MSAREAATRPRLVCFLPDLDGGGAQRSMLNLAGAFPDFGFNVELILARADGAARAWLPKRVPFRDLGCSRSRQALPHLIRALRAKPPDILFSTMVDANILAWLANFVVFPCPLLVLRETNSHRARGDLGRLRRLAIAAAYRRADAVIALSHGVGAELIEDYSIAADRLQVIHNPVSFAESLATVRPAEMPSAPCFVAAGRLTRQKNFGLLVKAMAILNRPVSLTILGDGPERTELEQTIRSYGLQDRITLPGFVSNPHDWFQHSAAFVLSSRWEGFGHVLVEAMSAGAPVISTDCPHGPRDIIEHGRTGLLVANTDAYALAAAMAEILDNPTRGRMLAIAARESAGRFSVNKIAGQYASLFQDLLYHRAARNFSKQ